MSRDADRAPDTTAAPAAGGETPPSPPKPRIPLPRGPRPLAPASKPVVAEPPPTSPDESRPVPEELSVSLADLKAPAIEPVASSPASLMPPPDEPAAPAVGPSKDPSEPLEGVTIGRYVLRHLVAQGGMASVYLAQLTGDEGFARWVAIKIIHPHLARDRRFVSMFLDEARIASRIGHPNVCAVLDYGTGPPPHLVMEHMHGEPLWTLGKAAASKGGVPVWLALRVVADAARGLHAAHELRGPDGKSLDVVHRDVSMQNVFVLYDGLTKVLDFGVAKARNRVSATETGELKGKIAYMAPDVLGGAPADRRADVWGLGVVLWELLAHRRLFRGPNEAATVHNVLHRRVPPLSTLRSDVPPGLEAILQRCLERDPKRRIQSAAQLAEQLEAQLHMSGVPAGAPQIASWMADALADRKATRERLLSQLASGQDASIAPDATSLGSDDLLEPSDAHEVALAASPPRRRVWALGALAAGVLGAVAIGWVAASPPGEAAVGELERASVTPPPTVGAGTPEPVPVAQATTPPITPASAETGASPTVPAEPSSPPPSEPERPVAEPSATLGEAPTLERATEPEREPRREGQRARTSASGTLNLMAVPPAEVFLGARSLGRTPLVNVSLPAGRHRLTLRPTGGGPERTTTVTVRPGARTLESVRFQ